MFFLTRCWGSDTFGWERDMLQLFNTANLVLPFYVFSCYVMADLYTCTVGKSETLILLYFCCPLSLSFSYSAHFISKCHRGFEDSPLWKMEQHKLFLHRQEIRKWRWSTPEKTFLLWASVKPLSSLELHNAPSGGGNYFLLHATERKEQTKSAMKWSPW